MRYKNVIRYTLTILFLLTVVFSSNSSAQLKIGIINTAIIMQDFSEMMEVQKQVEALQQKHSKELMDLENELKAKSKRFESQNLLLSDERKKQMQQELEELYRKGVQYQQDAGVEIQNKSKELSEPIIKKINDTIGKISANEKFDLVFDVVNMGILYSNPDKAEDITQKVIDELNKTAAK